MAEINTDKNDAEKKEKVAKVLESKSQADALKSKKSDKSSENATAKKIVTQKTKAISNDEIQIEKPKQNKKTESITKEKDEMISSEKEAKKESKPKEEINKDIKEESNKIDSKTKDKDLKGDAVEKNVTKSELKSENNLSKSTSSVEMVDNTSIDNSSNKKPESLSENIKISAVNPNSTTSGKTIADVKKSDNFESQKFTYNSDFQRNKSKSSKEFKKDGKGGRRDGRSRRDDRSREGSEIENVLVCIRRVTKVVKGGRTFRFSATVAVGDKKGKVGIAIGKASEVPSAIDKATAKAKKNMQKINLVNGTIPHETKGKFCSTSILLLPAKPGTGVIAGGSARAVLELAGITDIVTKIHGSTNSINVVKATFQGLTGIKTREQIAEIRGKSAQEI